MRIVEDHSADPPPRLRESHFLRLLEVLPAAAYTCDPEGRITWHNESAASLWGRRPKLDDPLDLYCGSFKLFSAQGEPVAHRQCWMARALHENTAFNEREIVVERPDGSRRVALAHASPLHDPSGRLVGAVNILVDITERKQAEAEVRALNAELEERVRRRTAQLDATIEKLRSSLEEIQTLRGLVNICAWCKKIRDEQDRWHPLESYLCRHTAADFSHSICPQCLESQLRA